MFLQTILAQVWLGNSLELWLKAAAAFLVVVGGLMLLRRVLIKRLEVLAKHTATDIDDLAVDLLGRLKFFFVLAMALGAAWAFLDKPPVSAVVKDAVLAAAWFVQGVIWINGLIEYWVNKFNARHAGDGNAAIIIAMGGAVRVVVAIALFLLCLNSVVNVTPLIAGLGIGGIAIALALQNILGDLFSAVSIMVDKPFQVGDFIAVDTLKGTVEHIGMKSTRVRSVTGEQIVFSNADLLKSRVRNFKRMHERRIVFTTHVLYDTSAEKLARIPSIIRGIIEAQKPVRFERCHFLKYADTGLEYETSFSVLEPDYNLYADIHQTINLEIFRSFEAEGIGFSFTGRTVPGGNPV